MHGITESSPRRREPGGTCPDRKRADRAPCGSDPHVWATAILTLLGFACGRLALLSRFRATTTRRRGGGRNALPRFHPLWHFRCLRARRGAPVLVAAPGRGCLSVSRAPNRPRRYEPSVDAARSALSRPGSVPPSATTDILRSPSENDVKSGLERVHATGGPPETRAYRVNLGSRRHALGPRRGRRSA